MTDQQRPAAHWSMMYPLGGEPPPGEWDHRMIDLGLAARPKDSKVPFLPVSSLRGRTLHWGENDTMTIHWFDDATEPDAKIEDTKPSNPKDDAAMADARAPMHLVPLPAYLQWVLAHSEGGQKYGWWNFAIVGVRASIYAAAAARHLFKWFFGQNRDPKTKVHHLGYVMACCAIIIDAEWRGKLTDDRPPALPRLDECFAEAEAIGKNLFSLFGDRKPRHFTIADTEPEAAE